MIRTDATPSPDSTRPAVPELLAPARDREAFLAAVAAGADAVYCGVTGALNARRKAAGIAADELAGLCALAHAHDCRVYVAANVAIAQDELAEALESIRRVGLTGVDAVIVQDWGLLAEVRRTLPSLEVHVSTQANVHDSRGAALCRELGATRVTLSRELSVPQIAQIHTAVPDLELEVFAHGSLCVCYSGLCMLSSFLRAGRSPNRGLCAQPCRLPFDLMDETGARLGSPRDERPLCMADVCALELLDDLARADVASLKVEGRMKPATYVHAVAGAWRRGIDDWAAGASAGGTAAAAAAPTHPSLPDEVTRSFNRGFTDAYLRGTAHEVTGAAMMSYERSTNRGQLVGTVTGFEPEPGFVPRDGQRLRGTALVRLRADVGAGDALELRHPNDPSRFLVVDAPRDAAAGETLRCPVPRPVPAGAEVRLTRSQRLANEATAAVAVMEHELARLAGDAGKGISVSPRPSGAKPARKGEFPGRDGITDAPAVMPASASATPREPSNGRPALCALVASPDDAAALLAAGCDHVYLDVDAASDAWGAGPLDPPPDGLVDRARADGLVPVLDEICHDRDHARLDPWVRPGGHVAVGNVSELALARERGALAEVLPCIPVHNAAAARTLAALGARVVWLSPELSLAEIARLARELETGRAGKDAPVPQLGLIVVGHARLATCERCVLQVAGTCDHACPRCERRRRSLVLRNIDGRPLPVRTDARGRSRIYDDVLTDLAPRARELAAAGVSRLMVDATLLGVDGAVRALRRLVDALDGKSPASEPGSGEGLLARGVL